MMWQFGSFDNKLMGTFLSSQAFAGNFFSSKLFMKTLTISLDINNRTPNGTRNCLITLEILKDLHGTERIVHSSCYDHTTTFNR
jgi:hypothetical protein